MRWSARSSVEFVVAPSEGRKAVLEETSVESNRSFLEESGSPLRSNQANIRTGFERADLQA